MTTDGHWLNKISSFWSSFVAEKCTWYTVQLYRKAFVGVKSHVFTLGEVPSHLEGCPQRVAIPVLRGSPSPSPRGHGDAGTGQRGARHPARRVHRKFRPAPARAGHPQRPPAAPEPRCEAFRAAATAAADRGEGRHHRPRRAQNPLGQPLHPAHAPAPRQPAATRWPAVRVRLGP